MKLAVAASEAAFLRILGHWESDMGHPASKSIQPHRCCNMVRAGTGHAGQRSGNFQFQDRNSTETGEIRHTGKREGPCRQEFDKALLLRSSMAERAKAEEHLFFALWHKLLSETVAPQALSGRGCFLDRGIWIFVRSSSAFG